MYFILSLCRNEKLHSLSQTMNVFYTFLMALPLVLTKHPQQDLRQLDQSTVGHPVAEHMETYGADPRVDPRGSICEFPCDCHHNGVDGDMYVIMCARRNLTGVPEHIPTGVR